LVDTAVVAGVDSEVGYISHDALVECLGSPVDQATETEELFSAFKNVSLFKFLGDQKLRELISKVRADQFEPGQNIITEGEIGDVFYIIKSGKCDIYIKEKWIRPMGQYDYFGERAILMNEPRSATVTATEHTQVWLISQNDFKNSLNESIMHMLNKRMILRDDKVRLDELIPIKPLGEGNFGTVLLCARKNQPILYALKYVQKSKVINQNLFKNLKQERDI
jgi:cGMP-dependent protein kinase